MMILTATLLLGSVTVVLPPDARVSGTELRLGSIARVEGDDPTEVASLKSMHLGYSPAPGYSRLFDANQLLAELRDLIARFFLFDRQVAQRLGDRLIALKFLLACS